MTNNLNVYIDSNVIINYCTGNKDIVVAMKYLFKQREKERLFTSSLAIAQTIATLQQRKPKRHPFTREDTIKILNKILSKFTVLELTQKDITDAFAIQNKDIEDNVHYVISQKVNCNMIVTLNTKDFTFFSNVKIAKPQYRLLTQLVK